MQRTFLAIVLLAFAGLTGLALWQHGYWGIFQPLLQSSAGAQVFADLAIALGLFLVWMFHDARTSGRNPWPWLAVTLALGSFGPLMYLLTGKRALGAA
ncbi:MAG: DUF2834 domain-containing protein [Burkholderiales bacterium]|nr:DUF2834 domain-containing protein [Burkholderiales bacterium]